MTLSHRLETLNQKHAGRWLPASVAAVGAMPGVSHLPVPRLVDMLVAVDDALRSVFGDDRIEASRASKLDRDLARMSKRILSPRGKR